MDDAPAGLFEFNSGRLCLDFTNTVRARPLSDRIELINHYSDLVSWARQATIVTPGEAALLNEEAARRPRPASEALSQALAVREAIHGLFSARAAGLPASAGDLRTLNRAIGRAMSHAGLVVAGAGFEWAWPDAKIDLDRVTWWVSRSAAELMTSPDLPLVRECAGYDCGWLFMDTTKNRSRRWCDMATCGNRAKGRRHYERRRAAGPDLRLDGQG
ncbi:MAG TPA: ABATE domain-containing protein [Methylomirabilota bacterium]|nr:ABATE domain-containing protein [Methylomirabilota bacterium]